MDAKVKNSEIVVDKSCPGLFSAQLRHKIASTAATMAYNGPKIPPDQWRMVKAFFHWTNATMHSESQVRLYVNSQLGTWSAWAFPQEARTGMMAKEISGPAFDRQRAGFPDSEGWLYFGTVHHHCSAGAFQSGTDEQNESNQDGLHITLGLIGSSHYDMHARFYLSSQGACFNPDLSQFWDIGEVASITPPNLWDVIARWQMTLPATAEDIFPEAWKQNIIEVKSSVITSVGGWQGYGTGHDYWENNRRSKSLPWHERIDRAVDEILAEPIIDDNNWEDFLALLEMLSDPMGKLIMDTCKDYTIDADDILKEIHLRQNQAKNKQTVKPKAAPSNAEIDTGEGWAG